MGKSIRGGDTQPPFGSCVVGIADAADFRKRKSLSARQKALTDCRSSQVSITLDGCFAIHEIKLIQTDHLFVAMPYRTDSYGISHDIVHPIGETARHELESAIITAYKDYIAAHENLVNADYTA